MRTKLYDKDKYLKINTPANKGSAKWFIAGLAPHGRVALGSMRSVSGDFSAVDDPVLSPQGWNW
jgi:hypothetical protein